MYIFIHNGSIFHSSSFVFLEKQSAQRAAARTPKRDKSCTPLEAPKGVLRRIEHAARNTAAAPLWRRSSLEWPCKIRILLLSIGRLCCIFGVSWGLLVIILGALGVHFGSQTRSFWLPGRPLAPWQNQTRKKMSKRSPPVISVFKFRDHFGSIF